MIGYLVPELSEGAHAPSTSVGRVLAEDVRVTPYFLPGDQAFWGTPFLLLFTRVHKKGKFSELRLEGTLPSPGDRGARHSDNVRALLTYRAGAKQRRGHHRVEPSGGLALRFSLKV